MKRPPLKSVVVVAVALVLAALGSYNIFLKATWTLMDDGVLWVQGAQGVYAARIATTASKNASMCCAARA